MRVISFASSKGGGGKTTSAIILGTELAEGASVIMIDADPAQRLLVVTAVTLAGKSLCHCQWRRTQHPDRN